MRLIEANGIEIACEVTGRGPAVVLCHGGGADHRMYDNLAPLLADRFTVVAYDQRDTGTSRNPASDYTAADLGSDLRGLIGALGFSRASVFGTSYGGMVALQAAMNFPAIENLIIAATWPGSPDGAFPLTPEAMALSQAASTDPLKEVARNALFFSTHTAEMRLEWALELFHRVSTARTQEQNARRAAAVRTHDLAGRLGAISARTLVLAGEDDRIIPVDFSRAMAREIPGAEIRLLHRVGHALTLEAPGEVADLIKQHCQSKSAR